MGEWRLLNTLLRAARIFFTKYDVPSVVGEAGVAMPGTRYLFGVRATFAGAVSVEVLCYSSL
jgi:hypothetical protein